MNTNLRLTYAVLVLWKDPRAAIFSFRGLKVDMCSFVLGVTDSAIFCAAQELLRVDRANPIPWNVECLIRAVTTSFDRAWLVTTVRGAFTAAANQYVRDAKATLHASQRSIGWAARNLCSFPRRLGI